MVRPSDRFPLRAVAPTSRYDEHIAGRGLDDALCDRSEQGACDKIAAAPPDDHELCVNLTGDVA